MMRSADHRGFTFIEIVMVIMLISILVGIAVPMYQTQVIASKEAVLAHNLAMIRERLDQHKADRGVYPASLEELVDRGYFREIPEDPFMQSNEWEPIYEDYNPDEPEAELGIYDVMSYSPEIGLDGRPYSEW
jgi:general secretion pathway protein G